MRTKTAINTGNTFTTPADSFPILGIRERWRVFCSGLSNTRISAGSTVTQPSTPSSTPFAITTPKSRPMVKDMKHNAMNPATVVMELPTTEVRVAWIAEAMASLLSAHSRRCSL